MLNTALATILASWLAMDGSVADVTTVRIQPIIGTADPGATALRANTFTVPTYSGYSAQAVSDNDLTASGATTVIAARKTFPAVASGQMSGTNKLWRFVMEVSTDGGSTFPLKLYSDIINSGNGAAVADGVEPYLEANTGFTIVWS